VSAALTRGTFKNQDGIVTATSVAGICSPKSEAHQRPPRCRALDLN